MEEAKERRPVWRSTVTTRDDDFNRVAVALVLTATGMAVWGDMVTTSLFGSTVLEPMGIFVTRTISGL